MVRAAPAGRVFLFLQGMATRFFERLGQALAERGHAVHRVNFTGGDRAFWRLPGATDFGGRPEDWPEFLDRLITEREISDIILFGDCRPLHRAAIRVAAENVPGVKAVEDHLVWVEPVSGTIIDAPQETRQSESPAARQGRAPR